MNKQAPSPARILTMVLFTLSCFGLLLFLWLAFGGGIPLQPKGYRFKAAFPEATTLAKEADVRLAGVSVGKVRQVELAPGDKRTLATIELETRFTPIRRDVRAILRQKTLLGETYVELTPGTPGAGMLEEGDTLADAQVADTTQIDEIFSAFDEPPRAAFKEWMSGLAVALDDRSQDLSDALANLGPFADDGAKLFGVLDEQQAALGRLVRNSSVVAGALNEREGALRGLIAGSDRTFGAIASRDDALAEAIQVFPTFLDESRATLARLQTFAGTARPVVRDLNAAAPDLAPTLRDLAGLSPDLRQLFRDLDPLIVAGRTGLPATSAVLTGLQPVLQSSIAFFNELNPILGFLSYNQSVVAGFLSNGAANLANSTNGVHQQTQIAIIDERTLMRSTSRAVWERGNAYTAPNHGPRSVALGAIEAFDCKAAGGTVREPDEANGAPPCYIQPPSLWDGAKFPYPKSGQVGRVQAPTDREGSQAPTR